jgi:Rieske 2Fe-2S family protein
MFVKASVGEGQYTLDACWYVDPQIFAAERERIFSCEWICVGRLEQLERPGDYLLAAVAGKSLILTRDGAGTPHAFYNVCRHRGTRICETPSGHFGGSIQCPYHAWTYALDGRLTAARNMHDSPGFDIRDFPLKEAAVATWEGFVFVNLQREPQPFERAFAPLLNRFAAWQIGSLKTAARLDYDLACNWKLVFLNYSECYHCAPVHPQLEKLSPSESGRNDLTEGPFLGGYSEFRQPGASLTTRGVRTRPPVGTVSGADLDRSYYYTIFPSMLLSLHADYVMVHYVMPVDEARTRVSCAFLFDPELMKSESFDAADAVEFWDLTNRQDWRVNELTQAGLGSRAYSPGPYAHAEGLLAAFDRHYRGVMGRPEGAGHP